MTKIEWTNKTWNPIAGCSVVSPGCTNCYAMRMAGTRLKDTPKYKGLTQDSKAGPVWNGKVRFDEDALTLPLKWRKPRRIFVNSMSDLFHEAVPTDVIARIFAVMGMCPRHNFQVLTKRPKRMSEVTRGEPLWDEVEFHIERLNYERIGAARRLVPAQEAGVERGVLPNVWLGTSVEDQTRANERIPHLMNTPAAVRFISVEPLLGPVDLREVSTAGVGAAAGNKMSDCLHWVIVGGESGPGARPMHPDWARSIRDECQVSGVAFFMKQMAKKAPIPDDLMIREWPDGGRADFEENSIA